MPQGLKKRTFAIINFPNAPESINIASATPLDLIKKSLFRGRLGFCFLL
jgi:hypothetical protein